MAYNPFLPWLEEEPKALYGAITGGLPSRSRNFMDYWRANYDKVYGQYMSGLGQTALQGQAPNQTFLDFMNQYNFGNRWAAMAPWDKGMMRQPRGFWNVGGG